MSGDPPPEVVAAARAAADTHAPYRIEGPVEWVRAPYWRIQAALDRVARHGDDPTDTYLVRLTGKFTSRAKPPLPSAKEIVAVVAEILVVVEASGPDAGRVRGGQSGGWSVDLAALGEVHRFDLQDVDG